jgi:acetyltransferase-like isoleucine patch superfamily enzyme
MKQYWPPTTNPFQETITDHGHVSQIGKTSVPDAVLISNNAIGSAIHYQGRPDLGDLENHREIQHSTVVSLISNANHDSRPLLKSQANLNQDILGRSGLQRCCRGANHLAWPARDIPPKPQLAERNFRHSCDFESQQTQTLNYAHNIDPRRTSTPRVFPQSPISTSEQVEMRSGKLFHLYDANLLEQQQRCAEALQEFNESVNIVPELFQSYQRDLLRIGLKIQGNDAHHQSSHTRINCLTRVTPPFTCKLGNNITLGKNVYIEAHCIFADWANVTIGDNTHIGCRVTITTLKSPTDDTETQHRCGKYKAEEVHIGANVWIEDGCVILAGVRIEDDVKVIAGSVVHYVS